MAKHILITGGSGLIGRHLTEALLNKGYRVSHLSRKASADKRISNYLWNVEKGSIDSACINGVDIIVHLAGSGIADKRWTAARKKNLIESRTKSISMIYDLLRTRPHQVTHVVSASGIGYYSNRGDELLTEDAPPAHDFFGECCIAWERAVDEGKSIGLQTAKFRTGVVLTTESGALPKLAKPIKLGVGAPLGNGKQWISWIHLDDAVALYMYAIENNLQGVFNMASPEPVTNRQFTKAVARQLHKPLWLPPVPAFLLKLFLGEMAIAVLGSTKVSAQKIESVGFQFKYPTLPEALREIYE
jgi:uncharacterized protein (TIGR01777 family)